MQASPRVHVSTSYTNIKIVGRKPSEDSNLSDNYNKDVIQYQNEYDETTTIEHSHQISIRLQV